MRANSAAPATAAFTFFSPRTDRASRPREDDPRKILWNAVEYVEKNSDKMDYPRYRNDGLPISSAPVESLVKQVNRRVKGTEKFWVSDQPPFPGNPHVRICEGARGETPSPYLDHPRARRRSTASLRSWQSWIPLAGKRFPSCARDCAHASSASGEQRAITWKSSSASYPENRLPTGPKRRNTDGKSHRSLVRRGRRRQVRLP